MPVMPAKAVLRPLLALTAAASMASAATVVERPVMKVVRLLQDMQQELTASLEDDKAVHKQLDCWCKTNEAEKTQAIEEGEQKEGQLKAFLDEAAARMAELKVKRDKTLEEVNRDVKALQEASELRMKENKLFHKDETSLMEAAKACQQALVVLGKHNRPDMAALQSAAQVLKQAQVLELGQRRWGDRAAPYASALRSLLLQANSSKSFLAVPGYQSYAPQSGQIFGVLSQMQEDFEKDLKEAQEKETKAAEDYTVLKAAKKEEIATGRKLQAELDQEIAELKEKHAQAFKELEDTQAQLELDRTFLANLKKKCSESEEEFAQRVKDRTVEIAAVEETIGILNNDAAFDNFAATVNTPSFLQMTASSAEQKDRLLRAADVLRRAAGATGAIALAAIATDATKAQAFVKVVAAIDKMIVELKQQQQDEVAHYDWCNNELQDNARSTAEAEDMKASLESKIADLEKTLDYLTKEIKSATEAVAEIQNQMKRASEVREAENADYQQTVTDHRIAQIVLHKAHERMSQVYALVQEEPQQPGAAHIATSATHTDPGNGPARFTKYEQHSGGGQVLRLLEEVIADSKKTEADSMASEKDAQYTYESVMKESNRAIIAYTEKITNMKSAKAKAEEEHLAAKQDHAATMQNLEELSKTLGGLKASCDFIQKNFDARQSARSAEIEALGEAKGILSGAK